MTLHIGTTATGEPFTLPLEALTTKGRKHMGRPKTKSPWSERLQRWDEKYGDLYRDAIVELALLSFEEAVELKAELLRLGSWNCSWWMYHAGRDLLLTAMPARLDEDADLAQLRHNAVSVLRKRGVAESSETYQAVLGRIAGASA